MPLTPPLFKPRAELRIALLLDAPWAFAEELCLEGVEVEEARRYAQWRDRKVRWLHVPRDALARALNTGLVDLAIGGVRATPELCANAKVALFCPERLDLDLCPDGVGQRHVWAVGREAWREWAMVKTYLQVIRPRLAGVAETARAA